MLTRSSVRPRQTGVAARVFSAVATLMVAASLSAQSAGDARPFEIIGHRGAAGLAPENTLAAFRRACALGVTGIELDVHLSADTVLVVHHDYTLHPELTRDSAGTYSIAEPRPLLRQLTVGALQRFDVGQLRPGSDYAKRHPAQVARQGERIPTLDEVITLFKSDCAPPTRLVVEIKTDPTRPEVSASPVELAERTVAQLRARGVADRTQIIAFDWRVVRHVQQIAPAIPTSYLSFEGRDSTDWNTIEIGRPGAAIWMGGLDVDDYAGSVPQAIAATGGKHWSPQFRNVTPARLADAHALGLRVYPWTVDDPADMKALIEMGVDGITTDRPDLLQQVLAARGQSSPSGAPRPPAASANGPTRPSPARPNVVLIMTDDMGWADLGSYGARDIRTPNLDRLAKQGVRFTQFYANATTCSPTRAGLITGRYQQRYRVEEPLPAHSPAPSDPSVRGLNASPYSLPRLLKNNGYATALIGKWHLGYQPEQSPNAHGFDLFYGLKSGYHDYYRHTDSRGEPDLWENETRITAEGYSTDLITARAVAFIGEHAKDPFFLDVAFNAPHWPFQRPDSPSVAIGNARFLRPADSLTSTRADYVRMVERMDQGVGRILAALEQHGLSRNTIVIFTNDNGGEWLSDNRPLFNRKYSTWEGGIRVPAIVRWPGRIAAGQVTAQVGITMDLTASILAATGTRVPAEAQLEGMNLFPILERRAPLADRTLFWRAVLANRTMYAVRKGALKMVVDANHLFLYDIPRDPGERTDLARFRTADARRLRLALDAWQREVDAEAVRRGLHN